MNFNFLQVSVYQILVEDNPTHFQSVGIITIRDNWIALVFILGLFGKTDIQHVLIDAIIETYKDLTQGMLKVHFEKDETKKVCILYVLKMHYTCLK